MLDIKRIIASAPKKPEQVELQSLFTPWGEQLISSKKGTQIYTESTTQANSTVTTQTPHPHPQFERERFLLLNGWWDYCITHAGDAASTWRNAPAPSVYDGRIRVPFSPEAPLSGVNRQLQPNELLWYRCSFPLPAALQPAATERCILHFEAVDYACACYINGSCVGTHVGGYLPFSFDITEALVADEQELALCVYDPSDSGVQLRGKQRLKRGGIWYTAQSGIWQTVWLECVPETHIASLAIDAEADTGTLTLTVAVQTGASEDALPGQPLSVRLLEDDREVCRATSVDTDAAAGIHTPVLALAKPHLWSPEDPHLYQLELVYGDDRVMSYCAFRTLSMEEDEQGVKRLCINHKPYFLRGVLDQGYWPESLLTAPSDEALIFDIHAMKRLGFNLLRKHGKIECDRWYYHCDQLGMLVWQDMVSGGSPLSSWHSSYKPTFFRWSWGHFADDTPRRYAQLSAGSDVFRDEWTKTCEGAVTYLRNHPSIITWVLFNEGWGQFEARKATEKVRTLDPSRPIDAVSGWYDQRCGDFLSVHNYFRPLEVYEDKALPKRAFVISEFGGLSCHLPAHSSLTSSYGYESFSDLVSFRAAVRDTLARADELRKNGLAGFVYTQLSDVEEETNGLLTYDRRINKLDETDSA